jgi:hypothetical protein
MNNLPICSVCNNPLDFLNENQILFNGFFDRDTQEVVHLSCKSGHYERKARTEFAGL